MNGGDVIRAGERSARTAGGDDGVEILRKSFAIGKTECLEIGKCDYHQH